MRMWRNWQTRMVQVHVLAREWRFKSSHPHHIGPLADQPLSIIDKYCYTHYSSGMNVNLGTVFDKFIAELLKSGMYQSQSEVVREGLRLLKEREELKKLRLAELRKQIAIGSEQADRGEFIDGEETFAEIRRRSAERKRTKG